MKHRKLLASATAEPKTPTSEMNSTVGEPKPAKTRVLIGIPTNLGMIHTEFFVSMVALRTPQIPGGCQINFGVMPGRHQASMREQLCDVAVEFDHTHILMLDTDMVYPPNTVERLLSADVGVICGFAMSRLAPHKPIFGDEGKEKWTWIPRWPTEDRTERGIILHGPQKSYVTGGAGLLISTEVLRKLPKPWFSFGATTSDNTEVGEDVWFSQLCHDHGIETYCDIDTVVHHLSKTRVVPFHMPANEDVGDNGEWQVRYLPQWGKTGGQEQSERTDRGNEGARNEDLVEQRLSGPMESVAATPSAGAEG